MVKSHVIHLEALRFAPATYMKGLVMGETSSYSEEGRTVPTLFDNACLEAWIARRCNDRRRWMFTCRKVAFVRTCLSEPKTWGCSQMCEHPRLFNSVP